ncbi:siderophore ABC transporter substrate-binding protein [Vibrio renipiscarius]|uniref:Enterochelin ABC transporter substrate-binding protein n=1 Tax=Vibrio renipiscarius TaxID=1461322 RepID=A0A0C2NGP6_9VIBR|nr:ABC transporter substrate-binding protein [Vibrio renipiscarius]KII75279.1 enterochelin ABC transporter substrate-binding protein [Vibrio renipiscarius]KII78731.1 enterochelin ABC transporter substrate-binding protein [Vibrio renipiscarius]
MFKAARQWLMAALWAVSSSAISQSIVVEHPLGTTTLPTQPSRVVVLGMDALDVMDYLRIEPIGVVKHPMPDYLTKYQAERYVSVGTLHEPDFETIYTLKPDLIIVSNRSTPAYDELSNIAPTVAFTVDARQFWPSTQKAWRMMGQLLQQQAEIERIIKVTDGRITAIQQRALAQNAQALMVMANGDNIATFGAGSRYDAIFNEFGFKEIVDNDETAAHGNLISYEFIAEANPDYLLVMDRDKAIGRESGSAKKGFSNALIKQTNAAKDGRITELNPQAWYLSAGGITATEIMINDITMALE